VSEWRFFNSPTVTYFGDARQGLTGGGEAMSSIVFHDETIAMTDEILKVESEIDARVKARRC
jgi:hypothetical protein